MIYKIFCFFIIIFTSGFQPAEASNPVPEFHLNINRTAQPDLDGGFTNYTGTIGKNIEVVFSLSNLNGSVKGYYFYQKKGINIALTGSLLNNNLKLYELDAYKKKSALITGKLNKKTINGNWKSLKSNKSLKLALTETAKKIPSLPKNILGNYKNSEDTKCDFKLNISKKLDDYFYIINTDKRKLKGKISFYRSLDDQLTYITFEDIEWAENDGAINFETDRSENNKSLPVGVDGLLTDGEVVIQNYGNAMNSYLKMAECDDKFIHLISTTNK